MNKEKIIEMRAEINNIFADKLDLQKLNDIRVAYLGKNGKITELSKSMKDVVNEEKKEFGMLLNDLRTCFEDSYENYKNNLEQEKLNKKLASEKIDITLPSIKPVVGCPSILEKFIEEMEELLMSMGYDVVEGPELEKDLYNFELLNLPKGHPARDAQDTFYTSGDTLLLRSQTSPVQIREMLSYDEKQPIRIICPGKTYRRDEDDATHSHQFTQIEGLLVDKDVSLGDLKGTFDVITKKIYGEDIKTRFRPSFYPFTEPSVEMDISCVNCKGQGCSICKQTGWVTVGGAGMVNPKVLENCGYDSHIWSGFAFGFGAERLAMIKYDIKDVRTFYNNDLRICQTFDRKESD